MTRLRFWLSMLASFVVGGFAAAVIFVGILFYSGVKASNTQLAARADYFQGRQQNLQRFQQQLQQQRQQQNRRILAFVSSLQGEGKLVVAGGLAGYEWRQAGTTMELKRYEGLKPEPQQVFVVEIRQEGIRFGIKHSDDDVEWVEGVPAVLKEDGVRLAQLYHGKP